MIEQPSLFDVRPLARTSDVETSHAAAEKAAVFKAKHEAKIYGALISASMTYKEIAVSTRLDPIQVARRLGSMCDRKLIERTGEKRGGCCVWACMTNDSRGT